MFLSKKNKNFKRLFIFLIIGAVILSIGMLLILKIYKLNLRQITKTPEQFFTQTSTIIKYIDDGANNSKINFSNHRYNAFDIWKNYEISANITKDGNIRLVARNLDNNGRQTRILHLPSRHKINTKDPHNVVAIAVDKLVMCPYVIIVVKPVMAILKQHFFPK